MIVAVDGPSGAGKSSVCREVARRLGFILVDTGALYRAVALMAQRSGLSLQRPEAIGAMANTLRLSFFQRDAELGQGMMCNGEDISAAIRTPEISQLTSKISQHSPVRSALMDAQQRMGRAQDSLVEGRDIGTVVFPDAELKVFYTASVESRTERRWKQLQEQGDETAREEVRDDLLKRDHRDTTRKVAPLRQADDAIVLDTSALDFEEACAALIRLVKVTQQKNA